jgi:glycosyltransferase involved in cell wall biosynthesis
MIVFIGPLAPPVSGFSIVTTSVYKRISRNANDLFLVNRGHPLVYASIPYYSGAFLKLLYRHFRRSSSHCTLYIALSGGKGQAVDLLFAALCAPFASKVFIHHHSFAYIYKPSSLLKLIYFLFPRAIDIPLCKRMGDCLLRIYRPSASPAELSIPISNAAWLEEPKPIKPKIALGSNAESQLSNVKQIRLGFLSKPLLGKGFLECVELCQRMLDYSCDTTLVVAGSDFTEISQLLLSRQTDVPKSLICMGVLSNSEINHFFSQVDLLLLPTRYKNEAEPLVILEAIARGIPVLANKIGCISSIIPDYIIPVVPLSQSYVEVAAPFVIRLSNDANFRDMISRSCLIKYQSLREQAGLRANILTDQIISMTSC